VTSLKALRARLTLAEMSNEAYCNLIVGWATANDDRKNAFRIGA
jgi:hypothetical protein